MLTFVEQISSVTRAHESVASKRKTRLNITLVCHCWGVINTGNDKFSVKMDLYIAILFVSIDVELRYTYFLVQNADQ